MTQVGEVVGLNLSGWTFFHIDLLKKLYWQLFGLFCKTSLLCKNFCGYFWGILEIFGLFLLKYLVTCLKRCIKIMP